MGKKVSTPPYISENVKKNFGEKFEKLGIVCNFIGT